MFATMLSCISELWKLLCESLSSTPTSHSATPFSTSASGTHIPEASTSSQTPTTTTWGVFISFRGVDTRNNFTSHLYDKLVCSGFPTFMDDPELRSGQVISEALFHAIQESKVYVVVFSENYASSAWCLNELVEILNCYKSKQRFVIPVFYNIAPSVVRYQTDKFKEAFKKHQIRVEWENVKKWRGTLEEISQFSGHHITRDGRSEAEIISEIINRISLDMNPKTLDVTKYSVGLDSRVKDIKSLMRPGSKGIIKIGVYGMGGIGKTTVAKSLFNQLLLGGSFKGSCFLANVRDASGNYKGIESLQQKLINEVLKSNKTVEVHSVEEGAKLIRERLCLAKVLVLVDDIYDRSHYESLVGPFASGSVVIITTRDEEFLDKIRVEPNYRYKVTELNDMESRSLFTKHAFDGCKQDNSLMVLAKDILRLAGGLPLALEVFGAYLSTQTSMVGWKSYIQKLQRDPDSSIQQKLEISLNVIESEDPLLKKIFLDIACFFIGRKKDKVVAILGTYDPYADHKIDILKKRCLLTINRNFYGRKELGMHDLLRDVGREIARNKSANEPENYSRLWEVKDIHDVLENQSGTKTIECIIYNYGGNGLQGVAFDTKTFERMNKLRFLKLKYVNLTGSFKDIFKDLRWLRWDYCPLKCLPSEFCPQKLVILELPHSNMTTMWELNMDLHFLGNLKSLNLSYSKNLSTIPDFTRVPCLETLNLQGCLSLEEIHMSIGSLANLVSLNVHDCLKLRRLPGTISDLKSLEFLDINHCRGLERLPNLSRLKQLKVLYLNYCHSLKEIYGLEKLTSLQVLDLTHCGSLTFIQGLEELISIRKLHFGGTHLAYKHLTKPLLQMYSEFGHHIYVYTPTLFFDRQWPGWIFESPYWSYQSTNITVYAELLPNESHNFMGMLLCFHSQRAVYGSSDYSLKNSRSGFLWTNSLAVPSDESVIILVPKSIFPISDDDHRIELTSHYLSIVGIHLLYKTETKVLDDVMKKHKVTEVIEASIPWKSFTWETFKKMRKLRFLASEGNISLDPLNRDSKI